VWGIWENKVKASSALVEGGRGSRGKYMDNREERKRRLSFFHLNST
jgi:hypothetical protein